MSTSDDDAALSPTTVLDLIRRRRSRRALDPDRSLADAVVRRLVEAARWAPSSRNAQPWRFVAVDARHPQQLDRARQLLTPGNYWALVAPVLVLVAARLNRDDGEPNRLALHDVGAATMAMALQAEAEGLVLHQMAGFDRAGATAVFGLPDGVDPVTMIALGYPGDGEHLKTDHQEAEKRRRPRRDVDELLTWGRWGHSV